MPILKYQEPCCQFCDVSVWSLECFIRNGYIRNPATQKWARDDNGEILKTRNRECNGLDPRPEVLQRYYSEIFAIMAKAHDIIQERIDRRERMAKVTYNIYLRITDDEIEKIYTELGDAEPTEENITATPTFRRILERLYAQMVKTDEENKKAAAEEAAHEV